jgi:hypothetical protein
VDQAGAADQGEDDCGAADALLLVERAAEKDVPILGVDGISIVDDKVESLIENIADFSSAVATGCGCWRDATEFIQSRHSRVLLFELVLGGFILPSNLPPERT